MFEKVGHRVIKLKRLSFGNINLDGLREGQWKYLTDDEIEYLKR
jgi:16S rRNA U516 pseudouridylate synthase RsuA-like enzyme